MMEKPGMMKILDKHTIDLAVVVIANLINLALIGLFLSRPLGLPKIEYFLGLFLSALALPLISLAVLNYQAEREWWAYVLPLVMATFLLIEFILEYLLGINWRTTWLKGPFLLFYYLSLMFMIGYAFLTGIIFGAITLITYFLGLAATWYSYTRVGY
jgi:hypothetical protein